MDNDLKISICGDICSECPRYIETQTNDIARLNELAELWFRLGFRTEVVSADDIKCHGCSKIKACSYNINTCEQIQHLNNCGECNYFPCDKLNLVFQKTDKTNTVCKDKCSDQEYNQLSRAFLMKKQILTEINENHKTTLK